MLQSVASWLATSNGSPAQLALLSAVVNHLPGKNAGRMSRV
jgi:hypothetical protein